MKFGEKISNIIKKEFNSKPVHKKKISISWKNQHRRNILVYLYRVILIHSFCQKDENYYRKVFLEKYYLRLSEGKMLFINDKREIHPDDFYSVDSDEYFNNFDDSDGFHEEYFHEKVQMSKTECVYISLEKNKKRVDQHSSRNVRGFFREI